MEVSTIFLQKISSAFNIEGNFLSCRPYGSGHINDTFLIEFTGLKKRFIFQRINRYVFKEPEKLMENISRVLEHLAKFKESSDERSCLNLIHTKGNKNFYIDENGDYWRCYIFIEGAATYDKLEKPEQAYFAAKAFGKFQKQLSSLGGKRLHDTIPDFHNTPKRLSRFLEVLQKDSLNRAKFAKEEIDFILKRENLANFIEERRKTGEIPEIITHNDTKINNVMLDLKTGEGVCVIDLDTVMPGVALYDFGDMVRTSAASSMEDEKNLSSVKIRTDIFEELVKGYIEGRGGTLNELEMEMMPISGRVITFETGIRFLTDFLEGDIYFKIKRDNHNLDRAKVQFKLVQSLEEEEEKMNKILKKYTS